MFTLAVALGAALALLRLAPYVATESWHRVVIRAPFGMLFRAGLIFAVQLLFILWEEQGDSPGAEARTLGIFITQIGMCVAVAAGVRSRWVWLVAVGLAANLAVMAANGGLMPVSPEMLVRTGNGHVLYRVSTGRPLPRSKDIVLAPADTRLVFLSDRWAVPFRTGGASPGDVCAAIGMVLILATSVTTAPALAPAQVPILRRRLVPALHPR